VIRPATPADLPRIAEIQIQSPSAAAWPVADYLAHSFLVAEDGGQLAGFLVWRDIAGESEILNLAVDPSFRRRGIAAALLAALPPQRVFLEVRASNLPARRLYEKAGFRAISVRRAYYHDPPEDGIVMEREI
jgi:[ribosomal protein S18]-alanine N-acetyltransferase